MGYLMLEELERRDTPSGAFPADLMNAWQEELTEAFDATRESYQVRSGYYGAVVAEFREYSQALGEWASSAFGDLSAYSFTPLPPQPSLGLGDVEEFWRPLILEADLAAVVEWAEADVAADAFWVAYKEWIPEPPPPSEPVGDPTAAVNHNADLVAVLLAHEEE